MPNSNGQNAFDSNHYSEIKDVASPVGTLRACRHLESGDRRAIKILRPDLAEKKLFFHWYMAAISLAGQAAESLSLPALISPIRSPQKTWVTIRDGQHVVERQYFSGTGAFPGMNLDEFLNRYTKFRKGIDDDVSLAIMSLVVTTLTTMHEAKLINEQGIKLNGVAHLNLKPENVLIGPDPITQRYQIKLTDYLVPMSVPLVEESGVRARLNYSVAELLTDNAHYGLAADIFSCGLLLYKLVENDDLITLGLSRNSTVEFIRNRLPEILRNLKLSSAKAKTREIIVRCLTDIQAERFSSMRALGEELEHCLKGKDPAEIIAAFAQKSVQEEPVPRQPIVIPWRKILPPIATIVIGVGGYIGYQAWSHAKTRAKAEDQQQELHAQIKRVDDLKCLSLDYCRDLIAKEKEAIRLMDIDANDSAINLQLSALHSIELAKTYCIRYDSVNRATDSLRDRLVDSTEFTETFTRVSGFLGDARARAVDGGFVSAGEALDSVVSILSGIGGEPRWGCKDPELIVELENVYSEIGELCQEEAAAYVGRARQACSEGDSASFLAARDGLLALVANRDCVPHPPVVLDTAVVEPPNLFECEADLAAIYDDLQTLVGSPCYAEAEELYGEARQACQGREAASFDRAKRKFGEIQRRESCRKSGCDEARGIVSQASVLESDIRKRYGDLGIEVDRLPDFPDAIDCLHAAKNHLDSGNCDKAQFRAVSAITSFQRISNIFDKYQSTVSLYYAVKNCLDNDASLGQTYNKWLVTIKSCLIDSCKLDYPRQLLDTLRRIAEGTGRTLAECAVDTETVFTYQECEKRVRSGSSDACKVCLRVARNDGRFGVAQKLAVIMAGRLQLFDVDLRNRLQLAYDNSTIDITTTQENAEANAAMACVYGWDTTRIDTRNALFYYDRATSFGAALNSVTFWWKARLVAVRCYVRVWRANPTPTLWSRARDAARDLRAYLNDNKVPGRGPFVSELEAYFTELKSPQGR